jgi:hypothetical protein
MRSREIVGVYRACVCIKLVTVPNFITLFPRVRVRACVISCVYKLDN